MDLPDATSSDIPSNEQDQMKRNDRMNEETAGHNSIKPDDDANEVSFLDMLIALAKHKKLLLGLPLLGALAAGGASLAMPDIYRASTVLLPPQQQQSGASALLSQLGGVAGVAAGMAGLKNPNDLYVGMLKSRTVADQLIGQFDLARVYGIKSKDELRRLLAENTAISPGKDGLITIQVEDWDKKRVTQLANGYVDQLLRLTRVLAVTEASQRRVFFERQLELAKNNLAKVEMSLKDTLDTHGVISVDGESRAVVETIARLRAQVSAKEIELNSMRAFVTTSHPGFRRLEEELTSLRSELAKLENGRGPVAVGDQQQTKQTGLDSIQRLRDLKYHQMLYELLAKQYEAARIDEAKDPSVIQVLDPAVEPERHVRPKRALMVLLGVVGGFFVGVLGAFFIEMKKKALGEPAVNARWTELRAHLRSK
jgi:uncharacterized protein involved in exopolysaccharide biosynthesis